MIAGAPGAFGSLVIFNSSGVIGCHSSPALTGCPRRPMVTTNSSKINTSRQRRLTIGLPLLIGRNAKFDELQKRNGSLQHFGEWTGVRSSTVVTDSRSPAM